MSCDVGKSTEGLENELWRRWSDGKVGEWAKLIVMVIAELILQPFPHFTHVTAHSPALPSLYLRHSSSSNSSVASPTSQLILQPFFRFSYVSGFSLTSPGEPPMLCRQDRQSVQCYVLIEETHAQTVEWPLMLWSVNKVLLYILQLGKYMTYLEGKLSLVSIITVHNLHVQSQLCWCPVVRITYK